MRSPMRFARTTAAVACALAVAAGGAACGKDEEIGFAEPAREGLGIEMAGITYNVFITRELNPAIPPDDAYYKGPTPKRDETLYGVFIQVCNTAKSGAGRPTAEHFEIVDNQGNKFEPEELPEENDFAYRPRRLAPQDCIPEVGSVAQLGPTAGSMLLFRLPLQNTENRPLELEVEEPFDPAGVGEHEPEKLKFELDI
jgi:uncharacterized membrane protein